MDRVLKTCLSPALDDNYLSKNNASTQVLYLNKRILSDFFQNENCWRCSHPGILLKADINQPDRGCTDKQISEAWNISTRSIERVRQRFVEESLENALNPRPKKSLKLKKIDGEPEAHLIALACSQVPQGYNRWTLRLLAEEMVS
jgi:hypothetical protein